MHRPARIWFVTLLILPAALAFSTGTVDISASDTSPVIFTIGQSDVVGGAGGDVPAWFETPTDERSFDIDATWINIFGGFWIPENWHVDVSRVDTNWHTDLHLYIRRTGAGTGATLTGGTAYQEIYDYDALFFSGAGGDCFGIPVQFRISGSFAANGIPADLYTTTVYYTVTGD